MKRVVSVVVVAVLVGASVWGYFYAQSGGNVQKFRLARVERGPLTAAVSATGNLNAVITVQVGSQVSGQIKELLVSFVARGGTIFLTSHILEIVERLSTHIGVIAQGRLVAQAPIAELREARGRGQTLEELFIGLVGADARPQAELDWF